MVWYKGEYNITDEKSYADADIVYNLLKDTYWGYRRSLEIVQNMIQHSLCFSLLHQNKFIGFARIVTDYTVFSWLGDVIINPIFRGKGLGKWMMSIILEHPDIKNTQMVLQTGDAHKLYSKYGFHLSDSLMTNKKVIHKS